MKKMLKRMAAAVMVLFLLFGIPAVSQVTVQEAAADETWIVDVATSYLALRSAPAFVYENEIGRLYKGDTVQVQNKNGTYWWVYAPSLGKSGYVNSNYLRYGSSPTPATTMTVSVAKGYLALRTAKAYDYSNEIGKLYSGDTVQVQDTSDSTYWWVYAPSLGKSGYVNRNYLIGGSPAPTPTPVPPPVGEDYTVSVAKGYLALRTAKAYDYSNEIGKLYSGDTFTVTDKSDSTYWWGYSPKLGKSGYVNRNYLVGGGGGFTRTVKVAKNYLALRNAKYYGYENEIGRLYTGDTVQVQDTSDATYWYVYAPSLGKSGYVNKNYLY